MVSSLVDLAPSRHHSDAMDLDPYVEAIQRQLVAAAETGGDEAQALAAKLAAALESAARLALQDALAAAVGEISLELAPGSVEIRLRGRAPEFIVTLPATASPDRTARDPLPPPIALDADEAASARINLRLPERLKSQIDRAATAAGLSLNAWLVRVAANATEEARSDARGGDLSPDRQSFKGWVR